jgi:hypothetical protein
VKLLLAIFLLFPSLARADGYDPFIDYSEFEEATQEEADINFFRNGRFLTIGLVGGIRGYTGNYGSLNDSGGSYGLLLAFFFDLQFALQVSYITSSHSFQYDTILSGTNETTQTSFEVKYFIQTQNVTKGLSHFNPYLIGGFSQVYRTYTLDQADADSRDGALGFNAGVGFEVPFSRNSAYVGLEAKYTYINFNDENTFLKDQAGNSTGFALEGDLYQILAILGVNF